MRETLILIRHFFRRFFDNDTTQVDGDTVTTVVRAIAIVAVPGLMGAFFLQNQYPQRPLWGAIEDHYFFVLFSFVAMGGVAIFEWEMLFPDKLDFLVLTPLSLKPLQMLAAKATALAGFLGLFLVSGNVFGACVLPAVSKGNFYRQLYAHSAAVLLAGLFAALLFLALGGLLLCVLSASQFRLASPFVQMVSVAILLLLLVHYAKYGDSIETQLTAQLSIMRWLPPIWFLGVYEQLLRGDAAPAFASVMAHTAYRATWIAAAVVGLTYPLAWARMRRMAVEGSAGRRRKPSRIRTRLVNSIIRRPGERAVFHFIGQTMARNSRYQVYLALYSGTGLALMAACALSLEMRGPRMGLALSDEGLHAMLPLLLFWVVAGLRNAFDFPLTLAAGWVFRVTGVDKRDCAAGARRWVLGAAFAVVGCVTALLRVVGWDVRRLLVQVIVGSCLSVLLTDGFFLFVRRVPFNEPRLPGRTNFPLILTLYVGVLTPYVYGSIAFERLMEMHPLRLLPLALGVAMLHAGLSRLNRKPAEVEEEMEGYEGEFQLLGLS